ncbi:DUF192 domain-containing protein [Adlercreutzia sp. R25]|uniref:DUF192 domain-containing protein n=1 Tax=Adlercreutzia shanghongiae TaxID=3111773 RepID=UPI002DBC0DBB|nr:DUF192 domain-containing protein [Adlercreutzia sp. R25]MEC4273143.1 DUF192 domain-containing protein [Adlercreutzia sp. R25]
MRSSASARTCIVEDGASAPFGGVWVVADRPLARLRGLAGRAPDKTVMAFPRCRDVHTMTMRYPLDVAFLDRAGIVVEVRRFVLPGMRLSNRRASGVVERFYQPGPWFVRGDRCRMEGSSAKRPIRRKRRRA